MQIEMVHRELSVAVLSDGQSVHVTDWLDDDGEHCSPAEATACVAGPDASGRWYAINLEEFMVMKMM